MMIDLPKAAEESRASGPRPQCTDLATALVATIGLWRQGDGRVWQERLRHEWDQRLSPTHPRSPP